MVLNPDLSFGMQSGGNTNPKILRNSFPTKGPLSSKTEDKKS